MTLGAGRTRVPVRNASEKEHRNAGPERIARRAIVPPPHSATICQAAPVRSFADACDDRTLRGNHACR
jgi:hypothetical protein